MEAVSSSNTEGQAVEITSIMSAINILTSYLLGKNVMISLGFKTVLPVDEFILIINDLVRQKEQRLSRILVRLIAHFS